MLLIFIYEENVTKFEKLMEFNCSEVNISLENEVLNDKIANSRINDKIS